MKQGMLEDIEEIVTDDDKIVKYKIKQILLDDGHGNHHKLYADLFDKFPVKVVPADSNDIKTAAMDSVNKVIYVNKGFLKSDKYLYQLSVLMRHELLHFILDHHLRMIKAFESEIPEAHLLHSGSLHSMMNTLEDFEVNRHISKASDFDRSVIHDTWLNGQIIHGLLVEDHRSGWVDLSVEDMLGKLEDEMAEFDYSGELADTKSGNLVKDAYNMTSYKRQAAVSDFEDLDEYRKYIEKSLKKSYGPKAELNKEYSDLLNDVKNNASSLSKDELLELVDQIKASSPQNHVDLMAGSTKVATAYTPEEKSLAIEFISILLNKFSYDDDYKKWYDEIMRVAKEMNLTEDQIKDLMASF